MKKIFIYGFDKFGKLETNPSVEIGEIIAKKLKSKFDIRFEVFGVDYDFKGNIEKTIEEFKPDFILGLGVAKRNTVTVERVALNVMHEPKPDNSGRVIKHMDIVDPISLSVALCAPLHQEF